MIPRPFTDLLCNRANGVPSCRASPEPKRAPNETQRVEVRCIDPDPYLLRVLQGWGESELGLEGLAHDIEDEP